MQRTRSNWQPVLSRYPTAIANQNLAHAFRHRTLHFWVMGRSQIADPDIFAFLAEGGSSCSEGGQVFISDQTLFFSFHLRCLGDIASVTILSPYRGQVRTLETLIRSLPELPQNQTLLASSVDGYQGREADVIIFTTVRWGCAGSFESLVLPQRFLANVEHHSWHEKRTQQVSNCNLGCLFNDAAPLLSWRAICFLRVLQRESGFHSLRIQKDCLIQCLRKRLSISMFVTLQDLEASALGLGT